MLPKFVTKSTINKKTKYHTYHYDSILSIFHLGHSTNIAKMKREGHQHGMVRTNRILPSPWKPKSNSKFITKLNSSPAVGLFTKMQLKPTWHQPCKFPEKCGGPRCTGCHMCPCCKSKDKTKGCQKLRSRDVVSNYRLISWLVVVVDPAWILPGFLPREFWTSWLISDCWWWPSWFDGYLWVSMSRTDWCRTWDSRKNRWWWRCCEFFFNSL